MVRPAGREAAVKARVVTAAELSGDLRAAWAAIRRDRELFDSPYFDPAYVDAVAACCDRVRIGVLEDGGRAVGFFPFEVGNFRIGGPVGGRLSDFQAVIAPRGLDWLPESLAAGCGLRLWRFDHVLCEQTEFAPHVRCTSGSPALDLRGGFDGYHAGRRAAGSRRIENALYKARKLQRLVGPLSFVFDARDEQAFERAIQWKREQCRRTGVADFFAEPRHVALVRRIYETRTEDFAGVLSVLRVGDRIAAVHLGMRSRSVLHHWFPGYEHELGAYSPGLILLLEIARAAAAAGIRRVDLGKGDDPYKRSFCTHEIPVAEGMVAPSPLMARLQRWHGAGVRFLRTAPLLGPVRALRRRLLHLPPPRHVPSATDDAGGAEPHERANE
jgi:CelD/BcsL family acetyltransferase involved in cellulose biosynthesis